MGVLISEKMHIYRGRCSKLDFSQMTPNELLNTKKELEAQYAAAAGKKLRIDMTRGKPCAEQLVLSDPMLDLLNSGTDFHSPDGPDYRNYGLRTGLPEVRELFARMMDVDAGGVILGENSSLNLMFDTVACGVTHGFSGCEPWGRQDGLKFLCPSPGYDRHFGVTDYFGFEPVVISMTADGPDMDQVEEAVKDPAVKGIWCVPKYQNPTGVVFSAETVRRFAALRPAAKDFRIFWDNAYCVHDLTDETVPLLSLWDECRKAGSPDLAFYFASTSKITFGGAGLAAMACGPEDYKLLDARRAVQTIGPNKLNELSHLLFLKNYEGVLAQMKKHRAILAPKFQAVEETLSRCLSGKNVAEWSDPKGGYFISVNVLPGCAGRVVSLCAAAGVKFTPAGATYPRGKDPQDANIRIAPTCPSVGDLRQAMELFCVAVQLAAAEKLLG